MDSPEVTRTIPIRNQQDRQSRVVVNRVHAINGTRVTLLLMCLQSVPNRFPIDPASSSSTIHNHNHIIT